MAMAGFRVSYRVRLFVLLLVFAWALTGIFIAFQYKREKEYKEWQLNALLQYYNRRLGDIISEKGVSREAVESLAAPMPGTRISIISKDGTILFDNALDGLRQKNHRDRPEVAKAIRAGEGCSARRHSDSTDGTYFYSATRVGDVVVRSAVPYTLSLLHVLQADKGFLWFMVIVTGLMSVAAWFATSSIGGAVSRLTAFARRAEKGERIYTDGKFPSGELGEISRHIVMLYAQRERRHEEALRLEREKNRIKKQLTNNINHELKTPLAAMQVCLETLMTHPELTAEKKEMFLKRCYDNSERLRALIADVATLTRLDEGGEVISREPVALAQVAVEAAENFTAPDLMPAKVDIPADIIIRGNASLLSALFSNLIKNANAYSHGTKIEIKGRKRGGKVMLTFADDGVGIPEEHLPHIFERFYRVDKGRSRANGGTGLGLSIVKNAVLFHRGKIKASNRMEGGLLFEIELPLEQTS